MPLSGPFTYQIKFTPNGITEVKSPNEDRRFSGNASLPVPKLYVVSDGKKPIYVGQTRQTIGDRMRSGFQSDGSHGYHGYAWRHNSSTATIDVWVQEGKEDSAWIETVEAEVVFLIRQEHDQWPEYQTEIHFHQSGPAHRAVARKIIDHYRQSSCPTA